MNTIIKYVFLDLVRNRTMGVYAAVLALLAVSVLQLDENTFKGLLSLMNLTLLFVPFISILFATIYYFNSLEFTELLLAQPIQRRTVLLGEYLGLSGALCAAYALGIGLPLLLLAPGTAALTLLLCGLLLTLIFSSIALLIFVLFRDKTKAIGAAIVAVLFFTLLFDGLLLAFIYSFSDYPIEKPVLLFTALNPVDLARVLLLLRLDMAALMGYSGALFKDFLGAAPGLVFSLAMLLIWAILPLVLAVRIFRRKDL